MTQACSVTSVAKAATYWNPFINSFLQWFGQPLDELPAWPLYETIVGTLLVFGALYYVVSVRGRARRCRVGGRDHGRGDDRLSRPDPGRRSCGAASDRRAAPYDRRRHE